MNLRDCSIHRAAETPEELAYLFLANGEVESEQLTYRELDRRARSIAVELQELAAPGDRAVLLYPPGLEFIAALFGCFYAGVVAVPAYPPRPHRANPRLRVIIEESRPTVALTTAPILARVEALGREIPRLRGLRWRATESLPPERAEEWRRPDLAADSLAFLQYTSGSTSDPKGVMVSHGNFLHNERRIAEVCGHSAATVFVGWLPLYHDMGLMGNVLQPLYLGGRCVLMSPAAFLQSPVRWLAAISRYRATTSGGPNFAYDLCVRRIDAEQRAGLDLRSWSVAFNGAEPVRAETLERFAAAFAGCGFRREAFFPCYGLAEATLLVTGGDRGRPPTTLTLQDEALARHRVVPAGEGEAGRTLVSCGRTGADQRLRIVDPESLLPCPAGQVGEIWVAGPSVGLGYWERPEESAAVFRARPAGAAGGAEEGPFLRTGDLGFLWEGELYVTGRHKDLVIIRGKNHYPQDLEQTAERSHPALLSGSAAFAVERGGEERLVLVFERQPRSRAGLDTIAPAVRWAITAEHQVQVDTVVLVQAGTIPKTTSGKVRRGACRDQFLAGGLEVLGQSAIGEGEGNEDGAVEAPTREALLALAPPARRGALTAFLRAEIGRLLRLDPTAATGGGTLDPRQPLAAWGLDSLAAAELERGIEQALGLSLPLGRLLDGASLEELTDRLLEQLDGEAAAPLPPLPPVAVGGGMPLSAMQKALWFEQRLAPQSAAYNVPFAARLEGEVDLAALRQALASLVERHAALRTTVTLEDGEPVQRIAAGGELAFTEREAAAGGAAELAAQLAEEAYRPFDLQRGPLFRVVLFVRPPAERVLLIVAHHLVIDGWSLWVLLDELRQLYAAAVAGRPADLPLPAGSYGEFVRWQAGWLAGDRGERLWEFWRAELAGEMALDLPFDRRRAPGPAHAGAAHPLRLGEARVRELRALAQQTGTTLYTVLLAGYMALLARYADRQEVLVGSPVAGRSRPELGAVVGCFFNTLALRVDLSGDPSFRALLGRLRGKVAAALERQDYPSLLLAERLQPGRQASGVPFFEAQFIFQQIHPLVAAVSPLPDGAGLRLDLGSLTLDALLIQPLSARSPLELELIEAGGELIGQLRYSADLFEAATVARLAEHWENLLREAAADADRPLSDLEVASGGERELLLGSFSRTPGEPAAEVLVHELFAEQVARGPERVAAVHGDRMITFAELAGEAGELASFLMGLDI